MLNRWLGIASVCMMLAVNAALVVRDVAPAWSAGSPPVSGMFELAGNQPYHQKFGIYNAESRRLGASWTVAQKSGDSLNATSRTIFESFRLGGQAVSKLMITTRIQFNAARQIDQLTIKVEGLEDLIELKGDFVEPDDFACRWEAAGKVGTFNLPAEMLRTFSDATRPFDSMKDLRIGQTWRMQVFNPLAGLMPDGGGTAFSGGTTVVRVSGQENLFVNGRNLPVFIVEADGAVAWVAPDGRVLRQEIDLPVLGRLVLIDEPYEDDWRERIMDVGH
jgi:hypothetical protein